MNGEQLKSWRQSKSLSRKELGADFGVSEHTVAKWEQNVNPIPKAVARLVTQLPQLRFTAQEFLAIQERSRATGRSIEEICIEFVREGLRQPRKAG